MKLYKSMCADLMKESSKTLLNKVILNDRSIREIAEKVIKPHFK